MTKTATQRDVTKIIQLAKNGAVIANGATYLASGALASDIEGCASLFTKIADIAKAIDARTGRRDPSVRKKGRSAGRKRVTR